MASSMENDLFAWEPDEISPLFISYYCILEYFINKEDITTLRDFSSSLT